MSDDPVRDDALFALILMTQWNFWHEINRARYSKDGIVRK
jgi:hypothetical protein